MAERRDSITSKGSQDDGPAPPLLTSDATLTREDHDRLDKLEEALRSLTILITRATLPTPGTPSTPPPPSPPTAPIPPAAGVPQAPLQQSTPTTLPPPSYLSVPQPEPLQPDVPFQFFQMWRHGWTDYAVMTGVTKMPRDIQLIHLRSCLSLGVQKLLQNSLDIPRNTSLSVDEVLDRLQAHFRERKIEALRRHDLLCCKQAQGESFDDFYGRVRGKAEEVDLCTGNPTTCAEAQLKMVILMGVRDEVLVQRLCSLAAGSSLQEVVTCCRSHEASRIA